LKFQCGVALEFRGINLELHDGVKYLQFYNHIQFNTSEYMYEPTKDNVAAKRSKTTYWVPTMPGSAGNYFCYFFLAGLQNMDAGAKLTPMDATDTKTIAKSTSPPPESRPK